MSGSRHPLTGSAAAKPEQASAGPAFAPALARVVARVLAPCIGPVYWPCIGPSLGLIGACKAFATRHIREDRGGRSPFLASGEAER